MLSVLLDLRHFSPCFRKLSPLGGGVLYSLTSIHQPSVSLSIWQFQQGTYHVSICSVLLPEPWGILSKCGSGYTRLLHTDGRMDPCLCPRSSSCLGLVIGQLQHARVRLICPGRHSRVPSRTLNAQVGPAGGLTFFPSFTPKVSRHA